MLFPRFRSRERDLRSDVERLSIVEQAVNRAIADAGDAAAQAARAAFQKSRHPMNRFGTPAEIAAAVMYLLSDEAGFTTGVALPVDGGRVA